jgi:ribosomal protein L29
MGTMTDRQEAFAAAFVANGGNGAAAARAAGYAAEHSRVEAYRLIRSPAVQVAIRAEQQRTVAGRLCSVALGVLEQIMCDSEAPAGARVDAAKTILDRGGLGAVPAGGGAGAGLGELREVSPEELRRLIDESKARLVTVINSRATAEQPSEQPGEIVGPVEAPASGQAAPV